MKLTLIPMAASLILAIACVPQPMALGPATDAGPPYCDTTCGVMWERAQVWLATHARYKIQIATDALLETYNPIDHDPDYGFSVVKEPAPSGAHWIVMTTTCGNWFGCSPRAADVIRAFYYYVAHGSDVLAGRGYLSAIR